MNTGIPLLDKVLEIFPWCKSEELKKMEKLYSFDVRQLLAELILLPILGFKSICDMAESLGRSKDQYYEVLKNSEIDWKVFFQEITLNLFLTMLELYENSDDPSFKSRWRLRLILDDTLMRRWSLHLANTFNIWNHVDKHYMYAQKPVFLIVVVGDEKLMFPLMFDFVLSKECRNRLTHIEIAIDMLQQLRDAAVDADFSLRGVRLTCDSGYTNKDIFWTAVNMGIEMYGSLSSPWKFFLEDGSQISIADLKKGEIPAPMRQTGRMNREYYRLHLYHPDLGNVVVVVVPYKETGTCKIKYWAYLCSKSQVDSVTICREHHIRWKIEGMFREFKKSLGGRFYQGISEIAQNAWFALTSLRFLFLRFVYKIAARFSSLRWHIPMRKFGFARFTRYLRDNFVLVSKIFQLKRLHYCIVKELKGQAVLTS